MILALRTDTATAELYLFDVEGNEVSSQTWEAGNQLSLQLLERIEKLLQGENLIWKDLSGIAVYRGPGSFTGLRIGLTVANTIAYARKIPVAGGSGDDWIQNCLTGLKTAAPGSQVLPEYGREANITKPRK